MKHLFMLILLGAAVGYAQEGKNSSEATNGEFGAVDSKIGIVRNSTAVFIGGRGGWIVDHSVAIGIEGHMLLNNVEARISDTSGNHMMTLDYGGIDLEYSSAFNDSWHLTFRALVGAGSIGHKEDPYLNRRQYHDPFFVFEPTLSIEMGVTKIFRIGIGASYRQVALLKSDLASSTDLSGPSAILSLKMGFL